MTDHLNRRTVLAGAAAVSAAAAVPGDAVAVASPLAPPDAATGSSATLAPAFGPADWQQTLERRAHWGRDLYSGRVILHTEHVDDGARHVWATIADGWVGTALHSQPNRIGSVKRCDGGTNALMIYPRLDGPAFDTGVITVDRPLTREEWLAYRHVRFGRVGRCYGPDFFGGKLIPSVGAMLTLFSDHDHLSAPDGLRFDGTGFDVPVGNEVEHPKVTQFKRSSPYL
jgi:hypothetical protein